MPGNLQEGFGCVVTNRFDQLFDDESDPFEILKEAEIKKDKKEKDNKTAASKQQPRKESQKDRKVPVPSSDSKPESQASVTLRKEGVRRIGRKPEQQHSQGEGKPGERRPDRRPQPRDRRFDRPVEEKAEGGEFSSENRPLDRDRPLRGRGGGRGRGRGRGLGRSDGFDSRGKREFDRHSGSDRSSLKPEDKRGGSGSHNWGTVKDELGELDQSAVTEEAHEGDEQQVADSENKENEVEEVKEEGPKEMTLDEWKAMQDKERAKAEFNIRKPNEGCDSSQWKKGFVLRKPKTEEKRFENEDVHTLDYTVSDESGLDHHFRKPANDITSQLEINFGDLGRPGRSGRGRGGRGRGGGSGRSIRGMRPDKSSISVPNVDDPEAFPALA
ncbi:SERPINE1 mRNA-binding protein 1-like isoform X2 [Narcine bancroftii]|uniref:SERPINE1 mRNA-binding protein 1-like isoform X2 n=1 Tax=Narcine bancroftii TaxID=1343680 RepID=UPI003831E69D